MTNSQSQPDFDSASVRPLLETLRQVLPGLERLVKAYHDFLPDPAASTQPSVCNSCPDKETCTEPCDDVRKALPKVNQGRGRHENLTGLHPETLQEVERLRISEIFHEYEKCKEIFTPKQWLVIYLYYDERMTEEQIAGLLGKARTTISDLLNRAKRKKDQHEKQIRAEKLEYLEKEKEKDDG